MKIYKLIDRATNEVLRFFRAEDVASITATDGMDGIITIVFKEGGTQSVPSWACRLEEGR